jgi:hypothetical protein
MRTWSLFSDGSSLTPALRPLPGFSSIKAEAGVWLVHNPVTLGHLLKELRYVIVRSLSNRHRSDSGHVGVGRGALPELKPHRTADCTAHMA